MFELTYQLEGLCALSFDVGALNIVPGFWHRIEFDQMHLKDTI